MTESANPPNDDVRKLMETFSEFVANFQDRANINNNVMIALCLDVILQIHLTCSPSGFGDEQMLKYFDTVLKQYRDHYDQVKVMN